jgi:hypothetical protein
MPSSERVTPGAVAIIKGDPPEVLLAESATAMARLLAVRVVAAADPAAFDSDVLSTLRQSLLEERWADAVVIWMETFDTFIDVYEQFVPVWTEDHLDEQYASMEIRVSRLFEAP